MAVFGDEQGLLDGTEFVQVMKRRNKVPGYKVGCCCCCCGGVILLSRQATDCNVEAVQDARARRAGAACACVLVPAACHAWLKSSSSNEPQCEL
jgi:hypothetical protein